jgi:hypothetical protein
MNTKNSAHKSNPAKVNLWVDLVIFAVMMLVLSPGLTGLSLHEWLGLSIGAGVVIHLLLHWQWIIAVIRRFFSELPLPSRINLILNTALFIDLTVAIFSGLMISREVLPMFGLVVQGGRQWVGLHVLSANLILVLTGLHVALHWKWIANSTQRYVLSPIVNFGQKPIPHAKPSVAMTVIRQEVKS